jgi:adenylate cyclase
METSKDSVQTVLFAEVSGCARLHEKLGQGEAQWAVDRCIKRMERCIEASSGRIAKLLGSELMATFQQVDAALQAATEMQHKVADLPPVSGFKMQIRVAFSYGTVRVENGEWMGSAVSLAASLEGLAEPGEILTDSATQAALSSPLLKQTRDRGAFPSKSQFSTLRIFEVISLHQADSENAQARGLSSGQRLLLRYAGKEVIIDDKKPSLRMGRDADNDVVIHGHQVSRHHAVIEKRSDGFILIDTSTNGSYLTQAGMPEVRIRRNVSSRARESSALPPVPPRWMPTAWITNFLRESNRHGGLRE